MRACGKCDAGNDCREDLRKTGELDSVLGTACIGEVRGTGMSESYCLEVIEREYEEKERVKDDMI